MGMKLKGEYAFFNSSTLQLPLESIRERNIDTSRVLPTENTRSFWPVGCWTKNRGVYPQIIHLFIGVSMI